MARRKDPANVAVDHPADKFPYIVQFNPNDRTSERIYKATFRDVITYLYSKVNAVQRHMSAFDRDVPEACDRVRAAIGALSVNGGRITEVIVPYHNVKFDVQVTLRSQI